MISRIAVAQMKYLKMSKRQISDMSQIVDENLYYKLAFKEISFCGE